jgi:hypothetical protein
MHLIKLIGLHLPPLIQLLLCYVAVDIFFNPGDSLRLIYEGVSFPFLAEDFQPVVLNLVQLDCDGHSVLDYLDDSDLVHEILRNEPSIHHFLDD